MKKKIISTIITMLLSFTAFCGCAFASEANVLQTNAEQLNTVQMNAAKTDAATKQDAATLSATKKELSVLFVGTSMLYYNNAPQMFERIAEAADPGLNVASYALLYASRPFKTHAEAVKAVYKVEGDASKLTKKQKALFRYTRTKGDPGNYKKAVFEEYAKVLYDSSGNKRHFDYIVMQPNAAEYNVDVIKQGICDMINTIADKNTTFVLHMPNNRFSASKNFAMQKTEFQNNYVKAYERVVRALNKFSSKGTKFKGVKLAYAGLAVYNYLDKYGIDYAQNIVPAEYKRYKGKVETDLTLKKSPHPTQLGTYLVAASFYSTITGKSAAPGASKYRATVSCGAMNIRGLADGSNYAGKDAFNKPSILKRAGTIAYQTYLSGIK